LFRFRAQPGIRTRNYFNRSLHGQWQSGGSSGLERLKDIWYLEWARLAAGQTAGEAPPERGFPAFLARRADSGLPGDSESLARGSQALIGAEFPQFL
jgi:hypothetical protein